MIRLQLIGHLGQNAIRRVVNDGTVLNFSTAHTTRVRDREGAVQERTIWIDCSLWNHDGLMPYLVTGKQVFVEGTPTIESYINNNGAAVPKLKLRIDRIQLLGGGREESPLTGNAAVDIGRDEADDLPF